MQTITKTLSAICVIGLAIWMLTNTCEASNRIDADQIEEQVFVSSTNVFDASVLKKQAFIKVKGHRFVDEKDTTFLFKGVSIADPDKLFKEGQWKKSLFKELKEWGVNTVRLPIHPAAWRARGAQQYLKIIDEAVVWANDLGLYLIVDWHSIGYLPTESFQRPMYKTTEQETLAFWSIISARYKNIPTIAVYEIFNEPTDLGGKAGEADWMLWKAFNEKVIDLIYAHDENIIPLVAGFNWAYDLTQVIDNPIARDGVAYVSHPYPQKERPPVRTKETLYPLWDSKWGHVASTYPIVATELGWVSPDGYGAHIPVKDDGSYGPMIIDYMDARGISWIAWCFDPRWSPTMIKDWQFTPTEQGQFFKNVLQKAKLTDSKL